jgi:hypothetical protein
MYTVQNMIIVFSDGYFFYWGCKFYTNEIVKAISGRDYNKCGMKMHDCRLGLEKVCNLPNGASGDGCRSTKCCLLNCE